jgi:LmbE family N-acetylglucosaminyl deacetylase
MSSAARSRQTSLRDSSTTTMTFADAMQQLPLLAPASLVRDRCLIVVAPHPDDESLGCGGLLAWASHHCVSSQIIFLTDGEQSHPGTRRDLKGTRRAEAICACACLGIAMTQLHFLGLPDAGLETLAPHVRDQATQSLRQLIASHGPSLVVTTTHTDPHGDHRAAFALTKAAIACLPGTELMTYPVWSWLLPDAPHSPKGARIAIADQLSAKRQAIAAYASQHGRLSMDVDGFTLPQELLHHVHRDTEVFLSTDL